MPDHDPRRGRADGTRRLDEVPRPQRQHRTANDAREDRRVDHRDGDDDVARIRAERGDDAEREEDGGKGEEHVEHATDREVRPTPEVARYQAQRATDDRRDGHGQHGDADGETRSEEDPAQDVAAERIGSEWELRRRTDQALRRDLQRVAQR